MSTERLHEIVTLLADSANDNESLAIEAHRLLNAASQPPSGEPSIQGFVPHAAEPMTPDEIAALRDGALLTMDGAEDLIERLLATIEARSQPPSGDALTVNETTLRNAWARLDQVGDPKTPHSLWKHLRNEFQPPSGDAPTYEQGYDAGREDAASELIHGRASGDALREALAYGDHHAVEYRGDGIFPDGHGCPSCDGTGFVSDELIDRLEQAVAEDRAAALAVPNGVPPARAIRDDADGASADVGQPGIEPLGAGFGDVVGTAGSETSRPSHPAAVGTGHRPLTPIPGGEATLGTSSRFHESCVTDESRAEPRKAMEAATPAPLEVEARQLISELAHGYHSYGLIKDHHDPADKTQWIVRGIETCADPLCVAACVYEEGTDAPADA